MPPLQQAKNDANASPEPDGQFICFPRQESVECNLSSLDLSTLASIQGVICQCSSVPESRLGMHFSATSGFPRADDGRPIVIDNLLWKELTPLGAYAFILLTISFK